MFDFLFDLPKKNKLTLQIIFLISILALLSYQLVNLSVKPIRIGGWEYSIEKQQNWISSDFDNENWSKGYVDDVFFVKEDYSNSYVKAKFYVEENSARKLRFKADDCVEEIYINQQLVFSEENCRPCIHCSWHDISLTNVKRGENIIAAKIGNTGGSIKFELKNIDVIDLKAIGVLVLISYFLLLSFRKLGDKLSAIIFFLILSFIFLSPIFYDLNYWSSGDGQLYFIYDAVPRDTILKYLQIPLWNPYQCGGNVLLANPQTRFLSLMFIFSLIDVVIGLKIQIFLHTVLGMFGFYLLSEHLGVRKYSRFLPSFIFMFTSLYALKLAEGHLVWMAMAWIPFVFLFFLKSFKRKIFIIPSSLFLLLILLEGSPYIFVFTSLFLFVFSFVSSVKEKKLNYSKIFSFIFILTFLLGAVKFLPMIEFFLENPRNVDDVSGMNSEILVNSLLNRDQRKEANQYENLKWSWHEFGAYIGILPLILALFGIKKTFKQNIALLVSLVFFLLLALGNFSPVNIWKIIHDLPFFNGLRVPSRFMLMVIFSISIFAAFGLSFVEKKNKFLAIFLVSLILLDLVLVSSDIFSNLFTIPPIKTQPIEQFIQIEDNTELHHNFLYSIYLQNKGDSNCIAGPLDEVHLDMKATPATVNGMENPDYKGEAYLLNGNGNARITYFSPNVIKISIQAKNSDVLVINQNYHNGWKSSREIFPMDGLISMNVYKNDKEITLYYLPSTFIFGSVITLLTVFILVLFLKYKNLARKISRKFSKIFWVCILI